MRQLVLDTETTGLNPRMGDRIVEIGCVELVNRRLTGRSFHSYLNPERASDPGALAVHGLTTEFLADKRFFKDVVDELRDFVAGAQILIHNAPFDIAFLDAELARLELLAFDTHCHSVLDTLQMAKELHPGKRNSLDALCERYGVSNSHRTLHGALLDAELLAEVYVSMTRGQESLVIDIEVARSTHGGADAMDDIAASVIVLRADAADMEAHERVLDAIAKEARHPSVWRAHEGAAATDTGTLIGARA